MAAHDILEKLQDEARIQATALDLPESYYPVEDAAKLLQISRAKLYRYLRDKEYQIALIRFENSRKRYVLAEDIRRLYELLHTPFLQKRGEKISLPRPAALPPRIAPPLHRVELQPLLNAKE